MFFPVLSWPQLTIFMMVQPCYSHSPNYCSTAFPGTCSMYNVQCFLLQLSSAAPLRNVSNVHFLPSCQGIYPLHSYPHFGYYFCILRGLSASQLIPNFQARQNCPAKNPPTLMTLQLHRWPSSDPSLPLFYLLQLVHTSCLPPHRCLQHLNPSPPLPYFPTYASQKSERLCYKTQTLFLILKSLYNQRES